MYPQNNLQLRDTYRRDTITDIRRYTVVEVKSLINIPTGAELFVKYRNQYNGFYD